MAHFRAILAYDGTRYQGFQRLPGDTPSIQGAVEAVLTRLSGGTERVEVIGAGRTDSGVHATGQVIAFELAWRQDEIALLRALNATLPTDIAVQEVAPAAPDFHPRYDATRRAYEYRLYMAAVRNPVLDRIAWQARSTLDIERMNAAAGLLTGTHDFASFGNPPLGERGTTRRTVFGSAWQSDAMLFGTPTLVYRIEADAFLYRMVRATVGTLVEVGAGRMTLQAFAEAFQARNRAAIKHLAPPHGLTLVSVGYERERRPQSS